MKNSFASSDKVKQESTRGNITIESQKKDEFGRYKTIIRTYKPDFKNLKVWELDYDKMTRLIKDHGNALFYRSQNKTNRIVQPTNRPESRNSFSKYDPIVRNKQKFYNWIIFKDCKWRIS